MGRKITFIGAGSTVFTQGLVADLIRTFDGEGWQLALVDVDEKALGISCRMCRKMLDKKNSDIRLTYSTDRRDVLPGSDYVVTMIGVGGRRAWEKDVFIPRKYGIFQPVGDSVMPGGISRAMRMVPSMLDISRDIKFLCPNAKFFNYANPMAIICTAARKAGIIPMVGLCHGVPETEGLLADFAEVGRDTVTSLAVGLNHLTFIYDFRSCGVDMMPALKYKLQLAKQNGIDHTYVGKGFLDSDKPEPPLSNPFSWELFEALGAFPAPGDRHVTEFHAERFAAAEAYYGKTLGIDAYSFEQTIEVGDRKFKETEALALSDEPLPESFFDRFSGEHEKLMEIISSIEHDSRKIFYANLPNNGAVPNLPRETVLELPAAAGAKGLAPLMARDLPDTLAAVISRHAAIVEVAAEAAFTGSKKLFAEAVLMGGYISDRAAVEKMVDELMGAHVKYLPQFSL